MVEERATSLVIRLARMEDIESIAYLDRFGTSPTRNIHRELEKYFGSVDPSTHERGLIFLGELEGRAVAKAELMLPPADGSEGSRTGYIRRVVVLPEYRQRGLARQLLQHIIDFARQQEQLEALDLHVWEENKPAIRLYESLGFQLQHRELYYRLPL
ncbi:GNAT family N-acetyltransferase [Thermogemmatispora sp.]|uniref:GNAT family N-acetyltransferase n=1 Tax=Thermogemmatispora sp. TaxID=1968838 RepID=UPI001D6D8D3D|nr:GNAT family N-acetyltransferase [Thermogemmatispora sp.]MBX5449290.1 GNAT family N-acetyltransferase [Thermogemmatispora sp.]